MSLHVPAPAPVQKTSRTRTRQKYSSARAFYITILVISAIASLSLLKMRKAQHDINGANHAIFSRTDLTIMRDGLLPVNSGELVRRDQEVRWIFFGINHRKAFMKLTMAYAVPTGQCR